MAQSGSIIKLDDLVTEKGSDGKSIEDRIYASNRESLKGADGGYYALPHYEWFPGLSYDKDNFDKNNWYIAKDAENGKLIENEYGSAQHAAFKDTQYKSVSKIKFDVEKINIPHFRVIQRNGEKIIVDNIGLVKALHVEERHKTF